MELTEKHRLTKGVTDVPKVTDSGEFCYSYRNVKGSENRFEAIYRKSASEKFGH